MVHCPNVFPLARGRHRKEGGLLGCLAHQIDNTAQLYPHCFRQKTCAPELSIAAPLDGHHNLPLLQCAKVGKDEYVGPQTVRCTHFVLHDL
jgi:hypothetical protein